MADTNITPGTWKLDTDIDPRGRDRFNVLFDHSTFRQPMKVAMLHTCVPREIAEEVNQLLQQRLKQVMAEQVKSSVAWADRQTRNLTRW